MNNPLINIITRTRNRPRYFKQCVDSLSNQTYSNIHHIVTYQVKEDLEYINKHKLDNCSLVRVPDITKDNTLHTTIEGNHLTHAPYNTFLNEAHKYVKEGWVMYLDDDDMLTYSNTLEFLINNVHKYDIDTKHFWRVQFPFYLLPHDQIFKEYCEGKPLKISQISLIGLLYHSSHLDKITFHEWACGDYFAFKELDKKLPKRNMINLNLTRLQSMPGKGERKDT